MPRLSIASTKRTAALRATTWSGIRRPNRLIVSPKGTATMVTETKKKENVGASQWRVRWAKVGAKSSLKSSLMASAKGWKRPKILSPKTEALLAPIRSCITALSLRSTQVRNRASRSVHIRVRTTLATMMRTSPSIGISKVDAQRAGQAREDIPFGNDPGGRPHGTGERLAEALDVDVSP